MSKPADLKVTYNPQDSDPQTVTQFGVTLEAGKAVNVPGDHEKADKFRHNPTFSVEGQEPPARVDENHAPTERDAIIDRLTARGAKVDRRASLATLQEQEAELNKKAEEAAAKAYAS